MKYKNISEEELVIKGKKIKAGEEFEIDEEVRDERVKKVEIKTKKNK